MTPPRPPARNPKPVEIATPSDATTMAEQAQKRVLRRSSTFTSPLNVEESISAVTITSREILLVSFRPLHDRLWAIPAPAERTPAAPLQNARLQTLSAAPAGG